MSDPSHTVLRKHVRADESGRYATCPRCTAPIVEVSTDPPYPDGTGETWVTYSCGSVRPDGDPEGSYHHEACDAFIVIRALHDTHEDHAVGSMDGCDACSVWAGERLEHA